MCAGLVVDVCSPGASGFRCPTFSFEPWGSRAWVSGIRSWVVSASEWGFRLRESKGKPRLLRAVSLLHSDFGDYRCPSTKATSSASADASADGAPGGGSAARMRTASDPELCISTLRPLKLQGLRGLELQGSVAGSFRWIL